MPELQLRGGEVDGLRLHYVVEGRGPAVILVHGLGGFAETWRHNIGPLASRATVFALDLPGFGASAKPRARYRLADFAGALRGFMDGLGLARASLVGHSLGGAVSITYSLTHPSRVERLALVGALVPGTRPPGGRLLRRLRIRDSHGRHGARRVPDNAPRRADRSGGSRGRLSPRADHARAAGVADPRSSGPRRAAGALRGGRRGAAARGGSLGRCVRTFPADRACGGGERLARGLSGRASGAPLAERGMDEITPQDLKARLAGNDRPLLLDVRQDWETRLCRLENAVHIPIEEIELRVDELNADDEIVVYCHQGVRSAAVADYLRQRGFTNVKNLHGGLDYWARTVDPSMRRY